MTPSALTMEPARLDDQDELLPLMIEFNRAEGIVWRAQPMTLALGRILREPELGLVLVARSGDRRALGGYAIATFGYDLEFAGRDAFVTELFVAAPFRGQGWGRALLRSVVEALRERETRAVHLMVSPENERARTLYESVGFAVSPRIMMTREL